MNKIIKATHSHYTYQRDLILAELDLLINKSTDPDSAKKTIELIRELSITNLSLNTVEAIINDNREENTSTSVENINNIAKILEEKLNNKTK